MPWPERHEPPSFPLFSAIRSTAACGPYAWHPVATRQATRLATATAMTLDLRQRHAVLHHVRPISVLAQTPQKLSTPTSVPVMHHFCSSSCLQAGSLRSTGPATAMATTIYHWRRGAALDRARPTSVLALTPHTEALDPGERARDVSSLQVGINQVELPASRLLGHSPGERSAYVGSGRPDFSVDREDMRCHSTTVKAAAVSLLPGKLAGCSLGSPARTAPRWLSLVETMFFLLS